ncbi:MAG: DEAD/DEAH box helicase [Paracoccaceae bacterium]|nr:DEAD/DEAH box helicase [Paracoccaceae bacterium]
MTKFSELSLDPKVLKAVAETGYESPTPIQAGAIPPALEGKDVLGIAQTGTGKTASFTLPMISLLSKGRARARMPRSLVLAPTRELAAQVAENFDAYSKYSKLTKALLIGGVSFKEQDKLIDRGVDVLIATPGRLLDHVERGKLLLTGVQIMVVDEADRMLDMGFIPDIERIFKLTPFTRQTLFFSATMAPEIERITNTFLSAPVKVEVARAATTSETITQGLIWHEPKRREFGAKDKRNILRATIEAEGEKCTNAIIFCNRKVEVDIVAKSLKKHGYNAEPIHGDLDQSHRMKVLNGFREGEIRFLCASDVAARGLDIPNVSHVFNFDVPGHAEDYVHRIGRTGRAGRTGTAFTIATPNDAKQLAAVEELVKMTIPRVENPWSPPTGGKPKDEKTREERKKREPRKPREDHKSKSEETPTENAPAVSEKTAQNEPVKSDDKNNAQREQKQNDRNQRGRGRGGRNNQQDRGPKVLGMGEHMPSFIEFSFEERHKADLTNAPKTEEVEAVEETVVEAEAVETTSENNVDTQSEAVETPVVEDTVTEEDVAEKTVVEEPNETPVETEKAETETKPDQ